MVVRVGDTWTYDIPATPFPFADPVWLALPGLEQVPTPEEYHIVLTGRAKWQDPALAAPRTLSLAVDLDAFDAQGNPLDWDSRVHPRVDRSYLTRPNEQYDQPIVAQSAVGVPAGAVLKVMLLDQSGGAPPASAPVLEDLRIVFVVVTAKMP